MSRDYKIRMDVEVPEATSANVTSWLEEALEKDARLSPDPGSGAKLIGLRLDPEKVVALANKKRERVPVMLRRLIASHVDLPKAEQADRSAGASAAEILPDKVLPMKLAYKPEDMLPIVKGMDKGLAMAYRRIYGLKELDPAQTAEEDRDLAAAMAECANRRSPEWLIKNADLAKLTVSLVRWSMAQTDDLEKAVADKREEKTAVRPTIVKPINDAKGNADVTAPAAPRPDELDGHMLDDVQQEGQF